jgi:hypothetical protein
MKPVECGFEPEVLAAVIEGRWEGAAELRAHAESCAICLEVAAVSVALREDREELLAAAPLPDAGLVWWKAQLRARREAAKVAGRPITAAQVMALATAAGLAGACFGATSAWFQATLAHVEAELASVPFQTLLAEHSVIAVGGAAVLLLFPAAVVWAILRD